MKAKNREIDHVVELIEAVNVVIDAHSLPGTAFWLRHGEKYPNGVNTAAVLGEALSKLSAAEC
jgi:hypothetical protein